ncbi:MAG: hypothetical protein IKH44_07345 [Bacteroidales bacterium]|nr:hypothetical protein [Bacteroidales bacterium]
MKTSLLVAAAVAAATAMAVVKGATDKLRKWVKMPIVAQLIERFSAQMVVFNAVCADYLWLYSFIFFVLIDGFGLVFVAFSIVLNGICYEKILSVPLPCCTFLVFELHGYQVCHEEIHF